jgi:hypothetical protein
MLRIKKQHVTVLVYQRCCLTVQVQPERLTTPLLASAASVVSFSGCKTAANHCLMPSQRTNVTSSQVALASLLLLLLLFLISVQSYTFQQHNKRHQLTEYPWPGCCCCIMGSMSDCSLLLAGDKHNVTSTQQDNIVCSSPSSLGLAAAAALSAVCLTALRCWLRRLLDSCASA